MGPFDDVLQLQEPAFQMPMQGQLGRGATTLDEMYPQAGLPQGPPRLGLPPPSQIQMYGPETSFMPEAQVMTNSASPLLTDLARELA